MPVSSYNCAVCDVLCDTEAQLKVHEGGRKHRINCLKLNGTAFIDNLYRAPEISLPQQTTPVKSKDISLPIPVLNSVVPNLPPLSTSDTPALDKPAHNHQISNTPSAIRVPTYAGFYCSICAIQMNSNEQYQSHLLGQKHKKKASRSSVDSSNTNCVTNPDKTDDHVPINSGALDLSTDPNRTDSFTLLTAPRHTDPSLWRAFDRSCREFLGPIWPSVTFTQGESDTLVVSSEFRDDCVLLLDDQADAWFRVGIHLVTGLLTANQDPDYGVTSAIWISPTVGLGPDPKLFSFFRFPKTNRFGTSDLHLHIAQAPFLKLQCHCDLFLTDADNFSPLLSDILFKQNQVCCIVIQDASVIASNTKLCDLVLGYLQKFPPNHRARIICLTDEPPSDMCLFSKFRLICFAPYSGNSYF